MKESKASVFAIVMVTFLMVMCPSAMGLDIAPDTYQGTKWVSVADQLKRIPAGRGGGLDIPVYESALLHQYAYARKTNELLVDIYESGEEVLPSVWGFPLYDRVVSAKNDQDNHAATEHLKKAIESFKTVVDMKGPFSRDDIGGLQGSSLRMKVKAAMGLCWCLHEQGRIDEARTFYPRLLQWARETNDEESQVIAWKLIRPHVGANTELKPTFEKSREIGVDELLQEWKVVAAGHKSDLSIKQSMARLHALVYAKQAKTVFVTDTGGHHKLYVVGEHDVSLSQTVMDLEDKDGVYRKHLGKAIALYESILAVPEGEHKNMSDHPSMVSWERMNAKLGLAWAQSQIESRAKTIERLSAQLEETIESDKKGDSGKSIHLWRFTQQFLDPDKDREQIQKTNLRFKELKLKAYVPGPYSASGSGVSF